MSGYLHIVCLDAPSPPDYGGAIDMFYKIKSLHQQGTKIILHYFNYKEGRGHEGLEPYCVEINRYNRTSFINSLITLKPYIVSSRTVSKLIYRLKDDDYQVLLEGIHCTGIIPYLKDRKIIVRVHNDEARYYKQLQKNEQNGLKALYFLYEYLLLTNYQRKLSKEPTFAFLSESDDKNFATTYGPKNQIFLPCFHPWKTIESLTGRGDYCLYHGNLSISENNKAAAWLAKTVFSRIDFPLIIAGKKANALKRALTNPNIKFVESPSDEELSHLIQNAHINVLPSFNSTGVKLKLLHALFKGRFCVSNEAGIRGSGLHSGIYIANDEEAMIRVISELIAQNFTQEEIEQRSEVVQVYDNQKNTIKLNELL